MDSSGLVQIPVDVSESIDAGYDDEGVRRNLPVCSSCNGLGACRQALAWLAEPHY